MNLVKQFETIDTVAQPALLYINLIWVNAVTIAKIIKKTKPFRIQVDAWEYVLLKNWIENENTICGVAGVRADTNRG